MQLKLVKPSPAYKQAYFDFVKEWEDKGEKIVPYAARLREMTYEEWLVQTALLETTAKDGLVPASLFFMIDDATGKILGAIDIRYELNEKLLHSGGHIGYGIRPSCRGQGLAAKMFALAAPVLHSLGLTRVLLVCDKDNPASAKTIVRCGGILEDERMDGNVMVQRYWIEL